MSRSSALTVVVAVGFSLWGCSDEKPGPGVGPETSWQIFCAPESKETAGTCSTSESPHGPIDGLSETDKNDDYKFKVTCSKEGSGLSIRIEDPGRDADIGKKLPERPRGILSITRGNAEANRCIVAVTEYPLEGGERKLTDTCENTTNEATQDNGSCKLTGSEDSNGYAFEGTIQCDALRYKGQGAPGWVLRGALSEDDPVVLQIANCD